MTPYHSGRQEYGFLWKKIKRLNCAFFITFFVADWTRIICEPHSADGCGPINRHRLHVIQFCLISSNHIGKYFRRCYRRRDLCRFNHPPSCFSGKRKQASQHMVTGWMKFTEALNGIALMVQHLIVKRHWSKKSWESKRNNISKKSCLHVATAKSKVSQLKTSAFYWNASMKNTSTLLG